MSFLAIIEATISRSLSKKCLKLQFLQSRLEYFRNNLRATSEKQGKHSWCVVPAVSRDEVLIHISVRKCGKAPGSDGIALKRLPSSAIDDLVSIVNSVLTQVFPPRLESGRCCNNSNLAIGR